MCFSLGSIRVTVVSDPSSSDGTIDPVPFEYRRNHDWRLSSRESFKSDQLRLIRIGEGRGSWRERNDPENRATASSLARLSPRLPRQREFMRHLFVVDSLDKRIQNEKEPIHLASAGEGGLFCICVESINLT